ncbi:MAG: hypothetical protein HKP38_08785 [Croceitalea sp.]|nr:hypothetical protein [Croceitalea sp.]
MRRFAICIFLVVAVIGLNSSCAEDQNFNQIEDISIVPTLATSIFYFESDEEFINDSSAGQFYTQLFTFEVFNQDFVADRILDGFISYQLENTTSKELEIQIEFLDENDNTLDSETFIIEPAPAPLLQRQIAYGDGGRSLDILKNTTNIRVSGQNLGDNNSISSLSEPKIILRSSAEFRLRLQ